MNGLFALSCHNILATPITSPVDVMSGPVKGSLSINIGVVH